jgi:hypothetical protein
VVTNEGIIYSERVRSLGELKDDDEAAAAEAAAQVRWEAMLDPLMEQALQP